MSKTKLDNISLQFRDDISFYIYVLQHSAWDIYEDWRKISGGKPKNKNKLRDFWAAAKKAEVAAQRQVRPKPNKLFAEPVPVYEIDGILHPAGRAKHIACAYVLGRKFIKTRVTGSEMPSKHKTVLEPGSKLELLPDKMQNILRTRKKIMGLLWGSKFGAFQEVPELAMRGLRKNSANRLQTYGATQDIVGKTILDVGCNMGMMSLECSKRAKFVRGIDPLAPNAQVATILKDFYKIQNAEFLDMSFKDYAETTQDKYDVILALAVHNWIEYDFSDFFQQMRDMLNPKGLIVFESHKGQKQKILTQQIHKVGFTTKVRESTQKRRFVLKCTKS